MLREERTRTTRTGGDGADEYIDGADEYIGGADEYIGTSRTSDSIREFSLPRLLLRGDGVAVARSRQSAGEVLG